MNNRLRTTCADQALLACVPTVEHTGYYLPDGDAVEKEDRAYAVTERVCSAAQAFFEPNYDLVKRESALGPKRFLGSKANPCRYCGRTRQEAKFSFEAHVYPATLGNKSLFTYEECNDCNQAISECEDDIAKMMSAGRALEQISGRSGVPSFKSNSKLSRIDMRTTGLHFSIREDDASLRLQLGENTLTLDFEQPAYRPFGVYKALVKMAIAIVPQNELDAFAQARMWLAQPGVTTARPSNGIAKAIETFIEGPLPFSAPHAMLFRRKQGIVHVPYAIAVIGFANHQFQIVVPSPEADAHLQEVQVVAFPTPFSMPVHWPHIPSPPRTVDLASMERTTPPRMKFHLRAESITPRV